ncbi:MAG: helix-turn-helix domain-containing protein [Mycoplasmataceae bacterium]|nr:helix-turn-helix domain-containing protein [Mycoplasmataceae bacterium]
MSLKNIQLKEFRKYFVELIQQASNLEGLALTYGQTKEIVESLEKSKQNYSWETIEVVRGIQKAYNYVNDIINSSQQITYRDAININKLIDTYESKTKAGQWRNEFVKIGGSSYAPALYTSADYINRINHLLDNRITFDKVVKLYADMSKMQFFINGNKRTSLCFCNAILIANDLDFIKIDSTNKFTDALVKYYENDKNFDRFLTLVQRSSLIRLNDILEINDKKTKIISLLNSKLLLNNITQSELANQVGITKSFVNQIISGKKIPGIEIAKKIAKFLEFDWKLFYD